MNPKISIIVPCYNVEQYLDRCMETLVGQTLQDIEIILVDDKSPDNVPKMCDEWARKDERIKVIHKKENEGLGYARNTGLEIATGEYVAFIDSDDWVEQDMFERLYDECVSKKLDVIYSEFNVDEYPGFRIVLRDKCLYIGKDEIESLRLDIVGAEPNYISSVKFQCSACKGLYSLDLIRKHNISFHSERTYISEDLLFNLDVLNYAQRVETTTWQFYHYCLNGASLTHSYRADRWQRLLLMTDKLLEYEGSFKDKKEFLLRLKRTGITYTRSGIAQQMSLPKRERRNGISEVINDRKVKSFVDGYPISQLPRNWKIFAYLIKAKWVYGLELLNNNKTITISYFPILKYLKNIIRSTIIYKWVNRWQDKQLEQLRTPYIPQLKKYFNNETSIICSNCFAGRIMQDVGMKYNTPTLGLYIWAADYIEFLNHLEFYLKEAKLSFVEHSKYQLGDERRLKWRHWYPIGVLNEKVEIHFLHYSSENEAAEKWYRRAKRVDFNNLFIIGMEQNQCTEKEISDFDKLPYTKKIFFSTKNLPNNKSNCFVREFVANGEVGDPYKYGHVFYKYLLACIIHVVPSRKG